MNKNSTSLTTFYVKLKHGKLENYIIHTIIYDHIRFDVINCFFSLTFKMGVLILMQSVSYRNYI